MWTTRTWPSSWSMIEIAGRSGGSARLHYRLQPMSARTGWAHGFAKAYAEYGVGLFAVLLLIAWWKARAATNVACPTDHGHVGIDPNDSLVDHRGRGAGHDMAANSHDNDEQGGGPMQWVTRVRRPARAGPTRDPMTANETGSSATRGPCAVPHRD